MSETLIIPDVDSLATLQVSAIGYGIRYEFGIFDQQIRDGWQIEVTDLWLQKGNPRELVRPEISFYVHFGGCSETYADEQGRAHSSSLASGALFGSLLPCPLEIIYEINRRFLDEVRRRYPGDDARVARLSLIDEEGEKRVRMANLAVVGSHAVNGVAALHSRLLQQTVLRDFAELWPERFCNVTNGVTPRRFMVLSNPALARLLNETVGRAGLPTCRDSKSWRRMPEIRRSRSNGIASSG